MIERKWVDVAVRLQCSNSSAPKPQLICNTMSHAVESVFVHCSLIHMVSRYDKHKHKQCAGSSIEARTFAILSLARGRRRQWRPGRKWSAAHTQWQVQCVHISRLHFTDKPNTTNGQIPQTITWPLPFHQRNVNSLACSGVHLLQPCLAPKRNKAKIAQIKRDILPAFNYRIAGIVW